MFDSPLIETLLKPSIFPDQPSTVNLLETHISWVLLTGAFAYKIKKPVHFEFLDYSDLSLRRHFCEEEIRLNRRLAPQLYLEVIPITGTAEQPILGAAGVAIEYAVKMRQFDPNLGFNRLAVNSALEDWQIDRLCDRLADFHSRAPKLAPSAVAEKVAQIQRAALQNFEDSKPIAKCNGQGNLLVQLREWTLRKFSECENAILERAEKGMVRECHGDLHLGNIVLFDDQPVPFDCIEFNEHMRWIDVIDEIAFVVMDLQANRNQQFGYRLLNRYLQITGDYAALAVFDYYRVYRAMVRAKVAQIGVDSNTGYSARKQVFESRYRNYVSLARACSVKRRVMLIITHGFSGSGKSSLASRIAELLPAIQIRSDVERKRLAANHPNTKSDLYAQDMTWRTYRYLANLAGEILQSGCSVIVDATFLRRHWRDHFRELADSQGIPYVILDIRTRQAILKDRIRQRLALHADPSDADLRVLELQQKNCEALTECEIEHAILVDSGEEIDYQRLADRLNEIK